MWVEQETIGGWAGNSAHMPWSLKMHGRGRAHPAMTAAVALAVGALLLASAARAEWPEPTTAPAAAEKRATRKPPGLPEPLVYLRDIDPSILQDMRYAGADNFTGRRVPGYGAAECVLLRDVAEALSRVQQALKSQQLSLKVYDCYRPRRAVRSFVGWVKDEVSGDDPLLKRFHPRIERKELINLGYVAAVSRHSLGDTVDLTLVELPGPASPPRFRRGVQYGACTGPAKERAPDTAVDMGTGYDCFDVLSHTNAAGITTTQRRWRKVLVDAMAAQGFRNYFREWWHFTLSRPHPGPSYDVPILPRRP
jgi:zinc D-Ala-D-Ala dipeptidase